MFNDTNHFLDYMWKIYITVLMRTCSVQLFGISLSVNFYILRCHALRLSYTNKNHYWNYYLPFKIVLLFFFAFLSHSSLHSPSEMTISHDISFFFFYNHLQKIEVQLIHSVVLVSGIQQNYSVIYMYILFQIISIVGYCQILTIVLCAMWQVLVVLSILYIVVLSRV